MDGYLKKLLAQLTAFLNKMSKRAKIALVAGIAVLVLAVVIVNALLNTTKYSTLYSGLSDQESGQIVTQLKAMGVKYKVEGTGISVDSSKADETRMQLAESGYPQSTLQYSVYSSGNTWAQTDSDKKQLQLYQLQTTLEQAINTIPGVTSSVVNIVQNQDDTYVLDSDKVSPTASVKLNLSPGVTLSKKQVNGIVLLVSHSVSGLTSDNVTVLDSDGTPLTDADGGTSGDTSDQIALKNTVESEIRQKVLAVLEPVFGSGNVQVAAGATLDFSQKTTSTTTYSTPQNSNSGVGLPSSDSTATTVNGASSTASGTAGVNNGQPSYASSSASSSGGTVVQSSSQKSYLYNTVNEQIQSQGATMTGLTIAVLLNNLNKNVAAVSTQQVSQTVAYAVGLQNSNGISVQMVPFAAAKTTAKSSTASSSAFNIFTVAAAAGTLLLLIIAAILTAVLIKRKNRKNKAIQNIQNIPVNPGISAGVSAGAEKPAAAVQADPNYKSIETALEESFNKNTVKKQIAQFADDKPELVAQLLKNWLKD